MKNETTPALRLTPVRETTASVPLAVAERSLAALRKDGTLVVENDRMRVRLSALEKAHQWLRSSEEPGAMPRPEMLSRLFA